MTAQVIRLEESPSQQFSLTAGDDVWVLLLMYNQQADKWSVTITHADETCPRVAGKFISENDDLLDLVSTTHHLYLSVAPGAILTSANWYTRMTVERAHGSPDAFLFLISHTEAKAIRDGTTLQPIC